MKQELGKNRIHDCLIASCCKHFLEVGVPVEFAAPCIYILIGTVIGRKLFLFTKRQYAYLNSFRFLISGPGGGKSLAIDFVRNVLNETKLKLPIMPSSITKASMVDELGKDTSRTDLGRDANERINQTTILASEYGILVGEYTHNDWFHTQCDLFDGRTYVETRRHMKEQLVIHNPYVNMLAGTQPMHWSKQFPREAWSLGYASRCDFYFADVQDSDFEYFTDQTPGDTAGVHSFIREVAHDLQCLHAQLSQKIGTQICFDEHAAKALKDWATTTRKATEFKDPWLQDYNQRRLFRLWRDCGLAAIARSDFTGFIEPRDFSMAYSLFAPQEESLESHLHRAASSQGGGDVTDKVWAWSISLYHKTKTPITSQTLFEYINRQVDGYKVRNTIDNLIDMGALVKVSHYLRPDGIKVNLSVPEYLPNPNYKKDLLTG